MQTAAALAALHARVSACGLSTEAPAAFLRFMEGWIGLSDEKPNVDACLHSLRAACKLFGRCSTATAGFSAASAYYITAKLLQGCGRAVEALPDSEEAVAALTAWAAEAEVAAAVEASATDASLVCMFEECRVQCLAQCGQLDRLVSLLPDIDNRLAAQADELSDSTPEAVKGYLKLLAALTEALADPRTVDHAEAYGHRLKAWAGRTQPRVACELLCRAAVPLTLPARAAPRCLPLAVDMLRTGLQAGEQHVETTGEPWPEKSPHWVRSLAMALLSLEQQGAAAATVTKYLRLLKLPGAFTAAEIPSAITGEGTLADLAALACTAPADWNTFAFRLRLPDQRRCGNLDCYRTTQPNGGPLPLCVACKRVAYCSIDCQRVHWPAHKARCKAYRAEQEAAEAGGAPGGAAGGRPSGAPA